MPLERFKCLRAAKSRDFNNQCSWIPGSLAKVDTDGLIHSLSSLLSLAMGQTGAVAVSSLAGVLELAE